MLEPGQTAPGFELPDADMQTVDLSTFKGKKNVGGEEDDIERQKDKECSFKRYRESFHLYCEELVIAKPITMTTHRLNEMSLAS